MKFEKQFVIGDIHGRCKALTQVLGRASFNKDEDLLIFVGDIVDRGWESFECVEILSTIKNLISIKGNHDQNFLEYIETGHDGFVGQHGVQLTKEFWKKETNIERKMKFKKFLENMIPYYIDFENRIFTHGGFDNHEFVENQSASTFAWDRELWKFSFECKGDVIPTVEGFKEIYVGHTPTLNYYEGEKKTENGIILGGIKEITYPMRNCNMWNMDTGAGYWTGKLSIMNIETKEIFQSDIINDLY